MEKVPDARDPPAARTLRTKSSTRLRMGSENAFAEERIHPSMSSFNARVGQGRMFLALLRLSRPGPDITGEPAAPRAGLKGCATNELCERGWKRRLPVSVRAC